MRLLHPLDAKLARDLWRLRAQALAIALIIASGVGVLCSSLAVVDALLETATLFYERQRFGDVFGNVTRAPRHLLTRIGDIPGVQVLEARVVKHATVEVEGFDDPVIAALVSIPEDRAPVLNRPWLRRGTLPAPGQVDGAVLSEAFADGHDLAVGDTLHALINGRRRALRVTGIALSPEYVYTIAPGGLLPDDRRFGVIWMGEEVLAAAFDLDGAFNDVSLVLAHGADVDTVVHRLDALLEPYGGTGAIAREDQPSNWFVMNEIRQLRSMAGILPTIFLVVAAFLTNMVLARLIATERSEVGLLKAFGYGNVTVAWHYAKLVLMLAGAGVVLGWLFGWWLGRYSTVLYADMFRFPTLYYHPGLQPFVLAGAVSLGAALAGALGAARRAARLPPAEAMRPPAPAVYRRAGRLSAAARHWFDQLTRIVLRQLLRWPVRALLTSTGVAAAVAVLVMSLQWLDALELMVDSFFFDQQRHDVMVSLVEDRPASVRYEIARLPGVLAVEAHRTVPARLRNRHLSRREAVIGVPGDGELEVLKDATGARVPIPPDGLVMSRTLADRLRLSRGDPVVVEVLEGSRPVIVVPVAAIFDTWIGTPVFIHREALDRALGDPPTVDTLLLDVDPDHILELFDALEATPVVGAVTLRRASVDNFDDTIAENMLVFVTIYVSFACTLAMGVVYNSMRIALSERGRELATLRVLGFTGGEVSYVLLGEAALMVLVALPIGCVLGAALVELMSANFETELFRVPPVVAPSTYGMAMLVVLASAVLCGVLVHRRVERLDLIRVLKTRE
ncbi:MAG: FtsX-like permease family protein [Ectothiorhodospiraceae bacterium]|nr:FtsX-like permease family protein [Chromatiales bacterium]MCP5154331.1 FtsX-like permease family protein [Ectothiorhodospiraceae bacterium]